MEADIKPHLSRYWLNNDRDGDTASFDAKIREISQIYALAKELRKQGVYVCSTDEKSGMQALERTHPTKQVESGQIERREHGYKRHGTQCLIANFDVALGEVIFPTVGETRTEEDFLNHIKQTVGSDPEAQWIFIVDQLNTHMSASLVCWAAQQCGIDEPLGEKGKSGILKSMATRKAFLEQTDHRIRFVYTPRHCSWMNQVEIWFSILVRKVLKRGSFASTDDLRQKVLEFIDYFNKTLAKPFKWTYAGRPLQA